MVEEEFWKQTKQTALDLIQQPDFWSSPDRFMVLGEVEYLDRIEAGLESAGSLLERLRKQAFQRGAPVPRRLTEQLAQQLFLIEAACEGVRQNEPRDAFLLVEAAQDSASHGLINNEFTERLYRMYAGWAEKRRMDFEILEKIQNKENKANRFLAAVSGYAAYRILAPEQGLHVFEVPGKDKSYQKAKALVIVEPQPDEPAGSNLKAWRAQADRVLRDSGKDRLNLVRRYREKPSPLVRDSVRNWRTGRLDRVLGGDFDLFAP
jgi:ATP-dependent Clp protease ATP-binding subunit ClpC